MCNFARKTAGILTIVNDRLIPRDFWEIVESDLKDVVQLVTR
jgi:hypothetical protein